MRAPLEGGGFWQCGCAHGLPYSDNLDATTYTGGMQCNTCLHLNLPVASPHAALHPHCAPVVAQAYPLDLVRTRLAAQTQGHYYHGISSTLRCIVADEGVVGLYRGLGATLLQVGCLADPAFGKACCSCSCRGSACPPGIQSLDISVVGGLLMLEARNM